MRKFLVVDLVPKISKQIKKIPTSDIAQILLRIEDALVGTPLDRLRHLITPLRKTPTGRIFVRELLGCFLDSLFGALQNSTVLLDSFVNKVLVPAAANASSAAPQLLAVEVLEGFVSTIDPAKLIISFGEHMLRVLVPFDLLKSIKPALKNLAAKTTTNKKRVKKPAKRPSPSSIEVLQSHTRK